MKKPITLLFDLTPLGDLVSQPIAGITLASLVFDQNVKFIPRHIEIRGTETQVISESSWRQMFDGRRGRFRQLEELRATGSCETSYYNLRCALHDLEIYPKSIFLA